ncbi:MAG: cytochrome c [Deltaproteobacteria bacterium]|nr:cytochrome c [Deltaproteobacteria bacterium]
MSTGRVSTIPDKQREFMIIRALMAAAAVAIGVTAVSAQSEVLSSTKLMREQGQAMYRVLNGMVKGEMPYDQAKADEALATLAGTAPKIPEAFPASIKGKTTPDSRFSTSAKAWENRADFEDYAKNLAKAIAENRGKVTSLEGLKAAYPALSDNCTGCHNDYRVRKS